MSLGIRQFQKNFVSSILSNFCGYFCCHFEMVVLQKYFKMFKGDANEDLFFPQIITYEFNGFSTGFVKLFVIFFCLVLNAFL